MASAIPNLESRQGNHLLLNPLSGLFSSDHRPPPVAGGFHRRRLLFILFIITLCYFDHRYQYLYI
jgi:hypothetical protein